MIPILGAASVSRPKIANTRCLPVQDLPDALTKLNSEAPLKRDARENLNRIRPGRTIIFSGLGVPYVVQFHAAGDQSLPASLTPPGQNRSSAFGFHPGAEAELTLSGAFRRLVGSFHVSKSWSIKGREG
jgi:hypothetical protein